MAAYSPGPAWGSVWEDGSWGVGVWGVGTTPDPEPTPEPAPTHGWTSADLSRRLLGYLGRGNGGVMAYDELWTEDRTFDVLADAQETVYTELMPYVPNVFVSEPTRLTTSDGGITYDFASYPFGHVEIYAQDSGARELHAASYGTFGCADVFVFEGDRIRMVGNQPRTFSAGPYARYSGYPLRLTADQEPMLDPPPARELILWKALELAALVNGAQYDEKPFTQKYEQAKARWLLNWKTQKSARQHGNRTAEGRWWLTLSRYN